MRSAPDWARLNASSPPGVRTRVDARKTSRPTGTAMATMVRYWRRRKAVAPSRMAPATSCIRWVPWSAASTMRMSTSPTARASTAAAAENASHSHSAVPSSKAWYPPSASRTGTRTPDRCGSDVGLCATPGRAGTMAGRWTHDIMTRGPGPTAVMRSPASTWWWSAPARRGRWPPSKPPTGAGVCSWSIAGAGGAPPPAVEGSSTPVAAPPSRSGRGSTTIRPRWRTTSPSRGDSRVDPEVLEAFCDQSRANLAWLEELGVEVPLGFDPEKSVTPTDDDVGLYFSGNEKHFADGADPIPRGHRVAGVGMTGRDLMESLHRAALNRGVQFRSRRAAHRPRQRRREASHRGRRAGAGHPARNPPRPHRRLPPGGRRRLPRPPRPPPARRGGGPLGAQPRTAPAHRRAPRRHPGHRGLRLQPPDAAGGGAGLRRGHAPGHPRRRRLGHRPGPRPSAPGCG